MSTKKSSENEEIRLRLFNYLKSKGVKQVDFARKTGYSAGQTNAFFKGKANLSERVLSTISSAFSLSEVWIRTGEGSPEAAEGQHSDPSIEAIVAEGVDDFGLGEMVLTRTEVRLVRMFRGLTEDRKQSILDRMIEAYIVSQEEDT